MSVSGVGSTTGTDTSNTAATQTATSGTDKLANESTFLQLLVAQIQNQDPLNPADGTQFLTQLAQFSQLEQLVGIRQDIGTLVGDSTQPTTTPTGGN